MNLLALGMGGSQEGTNDGVKIITNNIQDALYPNLSPRRVISNESRLLFIVFKIGLVEQGIKQDIYLSWQRKGCQF